MRASAVVFGVGLLAALWVGPLPDRAATSFTAHMTLHMGVVAVVAPLIALGLAGTGFDPARARPRLFSALPAALVELAIVWGWHAPALHHAARHATAALVLEQASFLAAGLIVWVAAVGGEPAAPGHRTANGIVALLLTSMHMTLLGALIALSPRPLYHAGVSLDAALADQHVGGAVMLLVGGVSYLFGGLFLTRRLLAPAAARSAA